MASCGIFQKLRPLSLLAHLSGCYDSAHLKVSSRSVSWSIYLEQGKITYASHSVDPFERLERHLHRLSNQFPTLVSETRAQLRLMFETDTESQSIQSSDYQAICWLVSHQYLNAVQAAELIEGLVKEVIESFLWVKEGTYELRDKPDAIHDFCRLDLQPIVKHCQQKLQGWQSLAPQILSPYQRPYFLSKTRDQQQLLPEIQQKLSAMLKGFSFRHLAVLMNQDELELAKSLYPYIVDGNILLHEPHPPFDQLPHIPAPVQENVPHFIEQAPVDTSTPSSTTTTNNTGTHWDKIMDNPRLPQIPTRLPENVPPNTQRGRLGGNPVHKPSAPSSNTATDKTATPLRGIQASPDTKSTYTIVCVDDSPTMLKEISYFLDDESFSVVTISDSVKALMQIVRLKPDLILLDVRMSAIDGYELCRLLRNHSLFKSTPIIMVTGNTGLIDRVKARLVGASGYLTKPFTQSDLLKIVFKNLT